MFERCEARSTVQGLGYGGPVLRRPTLALALLLLATATSASAALQPVRRDYRESPLPRVRAGTIHIPAGHASGLTRVIVRLGQAPLAAWSSQRGLAAASHTNRLERAHRRGEGLPRPARARPAGGRRRAPRRDPAGARAGALPHRLRRLRGRAAVPPAAEARRPRLRQEGLSERRLLRDGRPRADGDPRDGLLGRDRRCRARGSRSGWSTPASTRPTRILDPDRLLVSGRVPEGRHGDHDAEGDRRQDVPRPRLGRGRPQGLRRGRAARHARRRHRGRATPERRRRPGPTIPQTTGLSGVAPKAWIGNYRVFTVPTPLGDEANTPGDHRGVRGGGRRRDERHQLLGRRPADRSGERRDVRRRAQHGAGRASCR